MSIEDLKFHIHQIKIWIWVLVNNPWIWTIVALKVVKLQEIKVQDSFNKNNLDDSKLHSKIIVNLKFIKSNCFRNLQYVSKSQNFKNPLPHVNKV
jgi:hypothetical protein